MARVLVVVILCGVGCAEESSGGWDVGNSKAGGGGGSGDVVEACERYVAAAIECTDQAFGGSTSGTAGPGGVCDVYGDLTGPDASEARGYLDCLADLYESADCSTADGYASVSERAQDCIG